MTRSMTAFAVQNTSIETAEIKWELRSVNSRFLEMHFRLPEHCREIEPLLRERLRSRLSRGKVEVSLRTVEDLTAAALQVDDQLVSALLTAIAQVETQLPASTTLSPMELLRWPGVIKQQEQQNLSQAELLAGFDQALDALCAGREREGATLRTLLNQRLDAIAEILSALRDELPSILERQKTLLQERTARLVQDVDPARLEQEVALLLQKADVDEEMDRLAVHLDEVRRILLTQEPMGRKLDFLMQELNREANTLSSKSVALFSTQAAIDIKVLIEQMREQIQNIE